MAPRYPEKMWLMGPLTPMRFEATVDDCIVTEGEDPRFAQWRLLSRWRHMEAPDASGIIGPFTLDGMVQALTFRDGRVDFRNRWIRTPKYVAEERAGRALFEWADGDFGDWRSFGWGEVARDEFTRGVPQGTNNINVVPFAGSLLALGEQGSPPRRSGPDHSRYKGYCAVVDVPQVQGFRRRHVSVTRHSRRIPSGIRIPESCMGGRTRIASPSPRCSG